MPRQTAPRGSGFRRRAFGCAKESAMGRDNQNEDLPSGDEEIEREAEKSRERLDETPPPGTDPLHEGP